ncbi:MAG: hypothetical protein GXY47_10610 [Acidobacteria bacterium]|nr:hypothetical protein [Acidobacteriota bacterium]
MAPAVRRKKRKDEIQVSVGPFRSLADYKACEDIQREVWNMHDIDIVPAPLLVEAGRSGGILLGATSSLGDLVGFVFSLAGLVGLRPIQHSFMVAVRAAYRNFDVGYKLKAAERREALKRGMKCITSSFDPMQPAQAYFALGKLGQRAEAYEENFHGETTSLPDRGLPTDRVLTRWDLEDAAAVRRLEQGPPRRDLRRELKAATVINQLAETAPGLLSSTPVKLNCTADRFLFEIPYNLQEIKNRDLGVALEWQGRMRQVFRHYFRKNYAAVDFWVCETDGQLRSFYVLERREG